MARAKTPKKKAPPAASKKPKAGGAGKKSGGGGPQMGIGDFMQDQFEQNAGKKKRG
jgi:hypothetical protein